jgi:hypothetical protein
VTSLGLALRGVDLRSALIFLGLLRDFSRADMEGAESDVIFPLRAFGKGRSRSRRYANKHIIYCKSRLRVVWCLMPTAMSRSLCRAGVACLHPTSSHTADAQVSCLLSAFDACLSISKIRGRARLPCASTRELFLGS